MPASGPANGPNVGGQLARLEQEVADLEGVRRDAPRMARVRSLRLTAGLPTRSRPSDRRSREASSCHPALHAPECVEGSFREFRPEGVFGSWPERDFDYVLSRNARFASGTI